MAFDWSKFLMLMGQGVQDAGSSVAEGIRENPNDKLKREQAANEAKLTQHTIGQNEQKEQLQAEAKKVFPQLESGLGTLNDVTSRTQESLGTFATPYSREFVEKTQTKKPMDIAKETGAVAYRSVDPRIGSMVSGIEAEEKTALDQKKLDEEKAFKEREFAQKASQFDQTLGETTKLRQQQIDETTRHNKEMEAIALAEKKTKDKSAMEGIDPDTGKPFTSVQSSNAGYALRAVRSNDITEKLYTDGFDAGKISNAVMRPDKLNVIKDPKQRQYAQAARDFVNSILRPESGAVIAEAEFKNAYAQYFPQPGDDADTQEQKRINRLAKIAGLKATAGNAYVRTETEFNSLMGSASTGNQISESEFSAMNDDDAKKFLAGGGKVKGF